MEDLALSATLQRRLIDGLLDAHPLPWRIRQETTQEWICEVIDAKKKLVLTCMKETEAIELIEAAMALTTSNTRADREIDRVTMEEEIVMTKPKSASDLFDKLLPVALAKNPDKARELAAIYCFKVTSSSGDGGEWVVDCSATPPSCKRASALPASPRVCTIVVADNDMMQVIKDPNAAMQLYFQGRLVVTGDPMLAMKLQALFALVIPG